jgi:DNA-binding NarL/FixJ family response regulator
MSSHLEDRTTVQHGGNTIDVVAIERRLNGDPVDLTLPERRWAVRRLHTRGNAIAAIADRLGYSDDTIAHDLANEVPR